MTVTIETPEDLYEELTALPGTEVFLLGDGAIYGIEGLAGLRLISNAIYESARGDDEDHRTPDPAGQSSPQLGEAEAVLDRARSKEGLDYIVCFHFQGQQGWYLRWHGWTHLNAVRELLDVVRGGMMLDEGWE